MKTYEVELGVIAKGAQDIDVDYEAPQIILVESDHDFNFSEVEERFLMEIKSFNCDCVHSITELCEEELKEYKDYYDAIPKYIM